MSKFRLFLENFFIYGFGSIISKVIPFLMLPVITRLIPEIKYYGISDLSSTVVTLATSIGVMGMYDAMYRMFFERDEQDYKVRVCSTAFGFCLCNSLLVFCVLMLFQNQLAELVFKNKEYVDLVYIAAIATLIGSTNAIVAAPTRMQNQRRVFVVMHTLSPLVGYAVSIPMLLKGYYVLALPLAAMITAIVTEGVFIVLNHSWFSFVKFDKQILTEMLWIAVPIFPVFICYWALNSINRIILVNLVGSAQVGIYAVGSKLGHVSQLIYAAFAGGWQYFAFATMKDENQVKNNSLVFEYLAVVSYVATMGICVVSYEVYRFIFIGEYVQGYLVSPYLFLAPLLLMLYQIIGNQFLVVKITWPCVFLVLAGALVNIGMNFLLIPVMGIEGSAISSVLGYAITVILAMFVLWRMELFVVGLRFLVATIVFLVFFIVWRLLFVTSFLPALGCACIATMVMLFLYRKELMWVWGKMRRFV